MYIMKISNEAEDRTVAYLRSLFPKVIVVKKTILTLIIIFIISIPSIVLGSTYQITEYALYINGEEIKSDTGLYLINGEFFAPTRSIVEGLDASTYWDAQTRTVVINKDGNELLVPMDSNQFVFNGNPVNVSTSAQMVSGRTLLPIKSVVECFGYSYAEHEQKKVISVYSSDLEPEIFIKPQITNCSTRYYKETDSDFTVACDFNDGIVSSISINDCVLDSEDYTCGDDEILIYKDYLQSLNIGIHHLTITFQNDLSFSESVLVLNQYEDIEYTTESSDYVLYINGEEIRTDIGLYLINGEYFAPIRSIVEGLDASTYWDGSTRTVVIYKDGNELLVPMDSNQFIFNGNPVNVSTSAQMVSGRTLLPIKSVVECFGYNCTIDEINSRICIHENDFSIYSIDGYEKLFAKDENRVILKYKNNAFDRVNLFIGFYDETGKLQGCFYEQIYVSIGNDETELRIPEKTFGEKTTVKVICCNDSFCPLSYAITINENGYLFL